VLWRYASGQSTGSSHEKLGKPCQDRMACATADADATLIAVVADGAGTAELAHIGAEIAVATVSSVAQLGVRAGRDDYQDILREGATLARQRLVEAAAERKVEPRDLACTLLAVIVPPVGGGALQIGDGAIVIGEQPLSWRWVFWPQKGEYANTTFFLSDEKALANAEVASLPDEVQDVALMSDGLEPLALQFATRKAHEPFFRTVLAPLHAVTEKGEASVLSTGLTNLLASPAVRSRTEDDASLVIATRRSTAGTP
jgi:3-deoxy-D-manno-octulosonate 8-phosphate phosphatase KdsC-like HAD superfamily phosphatase